MLSYDGEGKLTKLRALLTNASNLSGTTLYGYNAKNELTGESSTRNGTFNNTFGYDLTGNPTAWNVNSQNLVRTFNVNNQETTGGTSNFNYDGEGNPTTYKGVGLGFDVNNQLTSYGTLMTAGYRSDGKRAWKQNASGTRTYFLYDGDALVAEMNASGTVTYTNTWGANGLVSRRDEAASSTRFYTWDQQGNVAQRLDASGNVLDSFSFTAFGQKTGTGGDPYTGYNGQWGYYNDYETGLILCTHRYYDSSNGRWLTRDPIGTDGGLNLYGYVTNNPTNLVDPSGLSKVEVRFKRAVFKHSPFYHAYIVVTETQGKNKGKQYYVRFGMEGGYTPSRKPGERFSFKQLGSNSGIYDASCKDWETIPTGPSRLISDDDNKPAFYWMYYFQSTAKTIDNARIPYHAGSTNSNAAVRTVLENAGLNPGGSPTTVNAPGWNTDLDIWARRKQ